MGNIFYIQWHITNLCNLRCRHCYQEDFSSKNEIDFSGLKKISDNLLTTLKEWGQTACIHLTGGEPLLKPELFPLLNYLDQHPIVGELGIITNGLLIDEEIMERLSDFPKLKKIKLSLDGADAETNDSIRSKGTFDKVIQSLSQLREADRFEIFFMFTSMKRNVKNLPSLFRLCQDLAVDGLIIERFIPLGRGKGMIGEVLTQGDWREMVGMLLDFSSTVGEESPFFPYQAFQIGFHDGEPELLGAPCVLGEDGCCIMPEGDVFPCRRFPISIGNLLKDPLKKIWEGSELLKKLRRKENLKGRCRRCEIKECRGCRSLTLALTGDYFEEDPHCWYPAT